MKISVYKGQPLVPPLPGDELLPDSYPVPPMDALESRRYMIRVVNELRVQNGRGALLLTQELNRSAQAKAEDMVARNYFAHVDPDGNPPLFGENLAVGYRTVYDAFDSWCESPGHYENMLMSHYRRFGFGMSEARYVQHFD